MAKASSALRSCLFADETQPTAKGIGGAPIAHPGIASMLDGHNRSPAVRLIQPRRSDAQCQLTQPPARQLRLLLKTSRSISRTSREIASTLGSRATRARTICVDNCCLCAWVPPGGCENIERRREVVTAREFFHKRSCPIERAQHRQPSTIQHMGINHGGLDIGVPQ